MKRIPAPFLVAALVFLAISIAALGTPIVDEVTALQSLALLAAVLAIAQNRERPGRILAAVLIAFLAVEVIGPLWNLVHPGEPLAVFL